MIDRNVSGVSGRVRGFRAARPEYPYPADSLDGPSAPGPLQDLARRLRRRRWIRARARAPAGTGETPPISERDALERELGAASAGLDPAPSPFAAEITTALPDPVRVGGGTVAFLGGRLVAPGGCTGQTSTWTASHATRRCT